MSVEEAAAEWKFWAVGIHPCGELGCETDALIPRMQQSWSVALDLALSAGRAFDRDRQQAIWQARLDETLVAGVAW